jgi:hypothetical protein
MQDHEFNDHTLFMFSYLQHQDLVNKITENADKDGICHLSQKELALKVGKSQAWVHKAISRINVEDYCITYKPCNYRVAYTDLSTRGVFSKIIMLMRETLSGNYEFIFTAKEIDVTQKYNIKVKTLQMFKAYIISEFIQEDKVGDSEEEIIRWIKKSNEQLRLLFPEYID